MNFTVKHIVEYWIIGLLLIIPVSESFLFAQNKPNESLAKVVDTFLYRSKSINDIKKLLVILKGDTEQFSDKWAYIPSINPLNPKKLKRFSSKFGNRFHPIDKTNKPHLGLDISAKAGTPIHAAASGIISSTVSSDSGYGNQVVIKHQYGFKTRYAHMYRFIVEKGQIVEKSDIIGFVGSTGKSTANHLHYEIYKNEMRIDPYPFCSLKL